MKHKWILLFLMCFPTALYPTTIKWLVKPEYDKIYFYSDDVLKCVKKGRVQLVDFSGNTLLPYAVDSVTDYSDGYALLLEKEGKKYRVCGIFGERYHDCKTVDELYYTERYSYCSEGYVSVANANGKQGYIDVKGNSIVRCQFREARPFKKGWASVSKQAGEAHYIDCFGNVLEVNTHITDATSFNDEGEALVGNYQKLIIINTDGVEVRKYKMKSGQTEPPVRPYDYVYDENWTTFEPERNKKPVLDAASIFFSDNGLYGLEMRGQIICAPQFDGIDCVTDELAIVRKGKACGVVGFVEGNFMAAIDPKEIVIIPDGSAVECEYQLMVPKDVDDFTFLFDDGNGERPAKLNHGIYRFTPHVEALADSFTFRARVLSDGLLLWQDEQTISITHAKMQIEVSQPYCTNPYADENDLQKVKAIVTNHSIFPVEVSTSVEVLLPSDSNNQVESKLSPSRELGPDETLVCYVTFKVTEEESVKVIVTANYKGQKCSSRETTITLRPFY